MKTYFRVLSFARPYATFLPQYIAFTLLGIIFSLTQFSLLKPLFDVIFEQLPPEKLAQYAKQPVFNLDIQYAIDFFYYLLVWCKTNYGDLTALQFICGVIVISVMLSNLFRYLSLMIVARIRARLIKNFRIAVFNKITSMDMGYFSNEKKGDILSRMTNDMKEVESTIVDSVKVLFRDPATILVFVAMLFYLSPRLTLFSFLILPVGAGLISIISKKLKRKSNRLQEIQSRIVEILDETLGGIRVIKAFAAKRTVDDKFAHESQHYAKTYVSMLKTFELASPTSQFLGVTLVSTILMVGGSFILDNEGSKISMDASSFLTYIIFCTQIMNPGKEVSKTFNNIQRGLVSARRLFEISDTQPKIVDRTDASELVSFEQAITFDHVSFAYESDKTVLKDVSFTVEKGKTIALVGASGGGKSTIADLIPRFYEPTSGQVLIDGKPLQSFKTTSLRSLMGIVTQESILFNDTVFNNIAFGIKGATEAQVTEAAKIANAHDFISVMENGYHTAIGDRGSKLSGGQRQRLSIARAVMKSPEILILDEATSALDSESEKLVQDALIKLMQNRTSVVIAHRLSTIKHADEIIVMDKGEVIQRGTHEDLINQEGQYKKLIKLQQNTESVT